MTYTSADKHIYTFITNNNTDIMANKEVEENPEMFEIRPHQHLFAACGGALLTSLTMTPLDVVKVRMQAQQKVLISNKCYLYCNGLMDHLCPCGPTMTKPVIYKGTLDALIKISQNEGVKSLWSGLSPTLILAIPTTAIYFVLYEQFKRTLAKLSKAYNKNSDSIWIPLISGSSARVSAVFVVSPLELIRTKMQSQKKSLLEITQSVKDEVKMNGIRGMWRGFMPTLMRDVPFSGLYWMNYENIKRKFGNKDPSTNSVLFNFTAGGISGCIAAVCTLPFDVIKTHQQIDLGEKEIFANGKKGKSKNTFEIMKEIYRKNGTKGLFAGLSPRVIKVAPACAIMIASFEYGKTFFHTYNRNKYYDERKDVT